MAQTRARTDRPVVLMAAGDMCFARMVSSVAARKRDGYPFRNVRAILRSADIAFGNLECVAATTGRAVPKTYNFRVHPVWAKRVAEAGFDVVSLANNHTMDYGREGLRGTLEAVSNAGLSAVGAGGTPEEARAPALLNVRGLRVGFLAYLAMFPPLLPIAPRQPAVAMAYPDAVRSDVAQLRRKVDVLVVSMHGGVERSLKPSWRQRSTARTAIDAGADLVLGHHPHIVQPVEQYRGRTIVYSLGNLVFSPSPSVLRNPDGPWGAICRAELYPNRRVEARLLPIRIVDGAPRLAPR